MFMGHLPITLALLPNNSSKYSHVSFENINHFLMDNYLWAKFRSETKYAPKR